MYQNYDLKISEVSEMDIKKDYMDDTDISKMHFYKNKNRSDFNKKNKLKKSFSSCLYRFTKTVTRQTISVELHLANANRCYYNRYRLFIGSQESNDDFF